MNGHHLLLHSTLSLSLLLFPSSNLFVAADSEPMSSTMEECKSSSKSFEETWSLLQKAINRTISVAEGLDSFTSKDYISYYTIVYELCTQKPGEENAKLLYFQYKKAIEDYISSKVLPSLRGKKDDILLRELLTRWSNHKTLTYWLLRFFHYLDRYYLPRFGHPSTEETSLLSFYDLVFDDEMNNQVGDAILSMIHKESAGEEVDWKLINNIVAIQPKNHAQGFVERLVKDNVAFYSDAASNWIASSSFKFKDHTPKEEKLHENPIVSSKRIKLVSSDGDVFEVDYKVAVMSQTIEDVIKANPAAASDEISISLVNSRTLKKVIEYCKKHTTESESESESSSKWDAEFLKVDQPEKLFDLVLASNYLNIKSLLDLTSNKIGDMMKGKSQSEIRKIFNIKQELTPQEEQEIKNEHAQAFQY
ncbi:hypothetical protein HN51_063759 [Arachis hypogaea]|uniref:SKP1-like protein n=2 Tax=Arachis TaxID=3817 RepID=A0A445AWX6_ARAHY|nr:cullin-1 [Arachis hypogaea]QHO21356.1 Cullin [Arachis hypogaea]RYR30921.1 hypothetical protein Ahy_B01g055710 [Arachis hypogaea]